jgi:uncharacterized repeat protein (TIGR03943 family)
VKREARAVMLVLVGAAMLHLSLLTDAYVRYVRTSMRPYLIAAGAVLLLLGLARTVTAVRALLHESALERSERDGGGRPGRGKRGRRAKPRHVPEAHGHGGEDDGHGHDPRGPRIAWLLALPVLTILLVSPPALGAYTAQHSADAVAKPTTADTGFPALAKGDPLVLPIADFEVRAVWDTKQSLKGRTVQLTGFAVHGAKGGWYLSRLTITCCAADAVTYKVEVQGVAAPPQGSWVKVTGVWLPNGQTGREGAVPALSASVVTGIATPHNPYE